MNHPLKVGDIVSELDNPKLLYTVAETSYHHGVALVRLRGLLGLFRASLFTEPEMPPTKHKLGVPKGVLP